MHRSTCANFYCICKSLSVLSVDLGIELMWLRLHVYLACRTTEACSLWMLRKESAYYSVGLFACLPCTQHELKCWTSVVRVEVANGSMYLISQSLILATLPVPLLSCDFMLIFNVACIWLCLISERAQTRSLGLHTGWQLCWGHAL